MRTKTTIRRNFNSKATRMEKRAAKQREILAKREGDARKRQEEKQESKQRYMNANKSYATHHTTVVRQVKEIEIVLVSKNGHVIERRPALDNLTSTLHCRKVGGKKRNCRYERTEETMNEAVVFKFACYE